MDSRSSYGEVEMACHWVTFYRTIVVTNIIFQLSIGLLHTTQKWFELIRCSFTRSLRSTLGIENRGYTSRVRKSGEIFWFFNDISKKPGAGYSTYGVTRFDAVFDLKQCLVKSHGAAQNLETPDIRNCSHSNRTQGHPNFLFRLIPFLAEPDATMWDKVKLCLRTILVLGATFMSLSVMEIPIQLLCKTNQHGFAKRN